MSGDDFVAWLGSVVITKPFTLDDARALFNMVHGAIVAKYVDVYSEGDTVIVRVETERGVVARTIPVV